MHSLAKVIHSPILIDANILMVGIHKQQTDPNYSFENMLELYMRIFFDTFQHILIHETVWDELDEKRRAYIEPYLGKNVTIVNEATLYGTDPLYTSIFNEIAGFDLFKYSRSERRNRGEVFTLAYAAYHQIPFVSSRDKAAMTAVDELPCLSSVELVGFELLLVLGYSARDDNQLIRRYRSIYKSQCAAAIQSGQLPRTFGDLIKTILEA